MPQRERATHRKQKHQQEQWEPATLVVVERQLTGAVLKRVHRAGPRTVATSDAQFLVDAIERKSDTSASTDLRQHHAIPFPIQGQDASASHQQDDAMCIVCETDEDDRVVIPEGTLEPDRAYSIRIRRLRKLNKQQATTTEFRDSRARRIAALASTSEATSGHAHAAATEETVVASTEIMLPQYMPKLPPR
jgi:hypothetical protein